MLARLRRIRAIPALLLFLFLLLLGDMANFFLICRRYANLVHSAETELPKEVIDKEAIVVLTGDRKRIPQAIELLRLRKSPLLLISGTGKGATLTELINSQAGDAGNAQAIWAKIVIENQSTSTIENAHEAAKIFLRKQIARVILITSEYHMLRSLLVFRSLAPGPDYLAFPVASEFSALLELDFSSLPEGLWKLSVEYWKYFLFRNYHLRHIAAS